MPLEVPNLDDKTWVDLVDEATSLIPRFAPAWTDHNVHDPGITFIELFAWLAEMQLYQLNRVGQRHREGFARLAGVRRRSRQPARVNIEVEGHTKESTFIPAGTQLEPLEGERIVFETEVDLTLTRSRLEKVIVNDGSGPVDQTTANAKAGIVFLAFGENADEGAEITLGFDAFYPREERELRLTAQVFTDDLAESCGADDPLALDHDETTITPPVELVWEYAIGPDQWTTLQLLQDETAAFSRTGAITLTVPPNAVKQLGYFWIRARIQHGYYTIEPRLRSLRVNVLPCSQKETVRDEDLGAGNGKPNQSFEFARKPVLITEPDSGSATASDSVGQEQLNKEVVVQVGEDEWRLVPSLADSGPDSKHYIFDVDKAQVQFGNGLNGKVPLPLQQVRALSYRTSNGSSGNVAKDLRWKFVAGNVSGLTLKNPQPATGGSDPEPLDEMESRGRALLNRTQRAVTLRDLELIALSTPDAYVARAKAIANCPFPESITVVALPKSRPGRQGPPRPPSQVFLNLVQRNLQRYRLLCDNLRVIGPAYVEVKVSARLQLLRGAGAEAVSTRASQAIDAFLTGQLQPAEQTARLNQVSIRTTPVASPCFTSWPFGRRVFPSELYAILDGVGGVDFASELVLSGSRDGNPIQPDSTGAIPIPLTGLVFPGAHEFTVVADGRSNR